MRVLVTGGGSVGPHLRDARTARNGSAVGVDDLSTGPLDGPAHGGGWWPTTRDLAMCADDWRVQRAHPHRFRSR